MLAARRRSGKRRGTLSWNRQATRALSRETRNALSRRYRASGFCLEKRAASGSERRVRGAMEINRVSTHKFRNPARSLALICSVIFRAPTTPASLRIDRL